MAADLRPLQPVVPHGRSGGGRPGRPRAALAPRRQQLRGFRRRSREALRPVHSGRVRDRRRHPLPPRREPVQPRRPRAGAELDHVPRRDGRLRRAGRARPALGAAHGRTATVVPVPGTGAERHAGDREAARRPPARAVVLPHDGRDDRGEARAGAPPRDGGTARLGALRAVGRRGARARGDRRGGTGVRAAAGRGARVLREHARVGLDPVPTARGLHRRRPHGIPRVAAGGGLRRLGVDRRQLRLRAHRGLLLHAVGPRLRQLRQVRPRLHRPRGAPADRRRRASPQGHARPRRRGRHPHGRDDAPEDRPREVHRLAVRRVLDAPVRPRDGRRRDGRGLDLGRLLAPTRAGC